MAKSPILSLFLLAGALVVTEAEDLNSASGAEPPPAGAGLVLAPSVRANEAERLVLERYIGHAVAHTAGTTREKAAKQCAESPEMFAWVDFPYCDALLDACALRSGAVQPGVRGAARGRNPGPFDQCLGRMRGPLAVCAGQVSAAAARGKAEAALSPVRRNLSGGSGQPCVCRKTPVHDLAAGACHDLEAESDARPHRLKPRRRDIHS